MSIPEMTKVADSSNISAIGYSPEAKELHVKFHSGGHYRYADVPEAIHKGMLDASSKGRFFQAVIAGKFVHTKVGHAG